MYHSIEIWIKEIQVSFHYCLWKGSVCVQTVAQLSCCIVNTYGRFGHAKFALICGCSFCKTWLNLAQTTYLGMLNMSFLKFSYLAFFENFPCTYLLFYIIEHPDCTEKNHILKWRYWWYARSHSQSSSLYSISNPMIPRCSSAGCSWKK